MDEMIAELRGLLAVASLLPWKHQEIQRGGEVVRNEIVAAVGGEISFDINDARDADLLTAAVNALPAVLGALTTSRDREKELEAALEPFAEIARGDVADSFPSDTIWLLRNGERRLAALPMSAFRRARNALSSKDQDQKGSGE